MGESSFCLSMALPSDPFHTCLIGIPLANFAGFTGWVGGEGMIYVTLSEMQAEEKFCTLKIGHATFSLCTAATMRKNGQGMKATMIARSLNKTGLEPQELDLLGSITGNYCLFFNYWLDCSHSGSNFAAAQPWNNSIVLNPTSKWYYNLTAYCSSWTHWEMI